jgi:hypothetical protein
MTAPEKKCPLCENVPKWYGYEKDRDTAAVECSTCGRLKITEEALGVLHPDQKFLLSAFCRRTSNRNNHVTILSTNIGQLIASLPKFSPSEKLDNLLAIIGEQSSGFGHPSEFNADRDYPLLIARGREEIEYFIHVLLKRGFVEGHITKLVVTMAGWERLDEMRKKGVSSSRCFIAMWFDESIRELFEKGIAPAVHRAGYEPLRIDLHEHVNRIDDEIIGQIKRSRFMVADFSGQRHGVYFEAGLMLGLGRTVIWMANRKEFTEGNGLHFDIRQFNFIAYESIEEAEKRLYDRILAIEGEGPRPSQ